MKSLEEQLSTIVIQAVHQAIQTEKEKSTFTITSTPIFYPPTTKHQGKPKDPLSIIRPSELSQMLSLS